jgi:peptidoglycan/xylan/chitin deacetylase (PgdA/CDA1 family)
VAQPDAQVIAARAVVPVLCWHQLRPWVRTDTGYARRFLICPPAAFRAQLDALVHAGHTTIDPDDYLAHLVQGTPLPPRPVLLSFDDSQASQIIEALPQLQARRMRGTFFAMTVVLDKPGWMSRTDLRRLHAAGMTVAAHTWDHHRADRYTGRDWAVQLEQLRALLEHVLDAPVRHFAYPYGAWSPEDFPHLQAAGYRSAYQLSDRPLDPAQPLLTLRRTLVESHWTGPQLLAQLHRP